MLFNIIRTLLIILEVFTCLALIAAVLLQKSKSQGMGLAFGGGMGESLFGAQIGNVMTKITIILATIFLVNTAVLAWMGTGKSGGSSVVDGMPVEAPVPAQTQLPLTGQGQPAAGQPIEQPIAQPIAQPIPEMPVVPAIPDTTVAVPVSIPEVPAVPAETPEN